MVGWSGRCPILWCLFVCVLLGWVVAPPPHPPCLVSWLCAPLVMNPLSWLWPSLFVECACLALLCGRVPPSPSNVGCGLSFVSSRLCPPHVSKVRTLTLLSLSPPFALFGLVVTYAPPLFGAPCLVCGPLCLWNVRVWLCCVVVCPLLLLMLVVVCRSSHLGCVPFNF